MIFFLVVLVFLVKQGRLELFLIANLDIATVLYQLLQKKTLCVCVSEATDEIHGGALFSVFLFVFVDSCGFSWFLAVPCFGPRKQAAAMAVES